jgi:tripeptidyl-peptidase-1
VSGTSCSAPTFGGFVALLNDVRLAAGKSPLGYPLLIRSASCCPFSSIASIDCRHRWLNPLLYAHPEAFVDITTGSNPGCAVDSSVGYLGTGFQAAKGWDPLTGLGTPNMTMWQEIVRSLP